MACLFYVGAVSVDTHVLKSILFLMFLTTSGAIQLCSNSTVQVKYLEQCVGDFTILPTTVYCGNWSDGDTTCRLSMFVTSFEYLSTNNLYDVLHFECNSTNYYSSDQCLSIARDTNSTELVNGDSLFCSISPKNCSTSVCYCWSIRYWVGYNYHDEFGFVLSTLSGSSTQYVNLGYYQDQPEHFHHHVDPSLVLIQFDNIKNVIVTNKSNKTIHCNVVSFYIKEQNFTVLRTSTIETVLSDGFFSHHGKINVTCFYENNYIKSQEFYTTFAITCGTATFPDPQWFNDFACLDPFAMFVRIIVVSLHIIALVLIVYFLKKEWCKVKSVLKVVYVIFIVKPLSIIDYLIPKRLKTKTYLKIISFIGRQNDRVFTDFERQKNRDRYDDVIFVPRLSTLFHSKLVVIILFFLPVILAQCDNSNVILGEFSSCSSNSGIKTCSLKFNSEIKFSPFMRSSCLYVQDSENHTALAIDIKLEAIEHSLAFETQYYTSDYTYQENKFYTCGNYFSGHCRTDQCSSFNKEECLDAGFGCQITDPSYTQAVGKSSCSVHNYDECFLPFACSYSRTVIKPLTPAYTIVKPVQQFVKPIFSLTAKNSVFNQALKINAFGSKYYVGSDKKVSMIVNGLFQGSVLDYFPNKLISISGSNAYMVETSQKDIPIAGRFGSIQASSPGKLFTGGSNNYIYDHKMINYLNGQSSIISSPGKPTSSSKFPLYLLGNLWHFRDGKLFSNVTQENVVSVTITTEIPVTIQYTESFIDIDVKLLNVSGCFKCVQGAYAYFSAFSRRDSGSVIISTDDNTIDLMTKTVYLTNSSNVILVAFLASTRSNSFVLTFSSKDTVQRVKIAFTATQVITTPDQRQTHTSSQNNMDHLPGKEDSDDGWFDFSKMFNSDFFGGILKNPLSDMSLSKFAFIVVCFIGLVSTSLLIFALIRKIYMYAVNMKKLKRT